MNAVLLVAHGTVERLDDLPAFLANIRRGQPVPEAMVRELRRRYEAIGGRSPLTDVTRRLAAKVEAALGGAATTQAQFDAMVSFAYNVGVANLQSSTLLKKHKAGDHAGAAAEFAKWNKAAGRVMPGLTRRRAAEAALYSSP